MLEQMQREHPIMELINPGASDIESGNKSTCEGLRPSRDSQPVRCFGCTTAELKTMAEWLTQCGIRTVAMQSTGGYWIAVYDILEEAGRGGDLGNCRQRKKLPGGEEDVPGRPARIKAAHARVMTKTLRPSP